MKEISEKRKLYQQAIDLSLLIRETKDVMKVAELQKQINELIKTWTTK